MHLSLVFLPHVRVEVPQEWPTPGAWQAVHGADPALCPRPGKDRSRGRQGVGVGQGGRLEGSSCLCRLPGGTQDLPYCSSGHVVPLRIGYM